MAHKIDKRCADLAKKAAQAIAKDPTRTEEILRQMYMQCLTDIEARYKVIAAVDKDGRMKDFFAIPHDDKAE